MVIAAIRVLVYLSLVVANLKMGKVKKICQKTRGRNSETKINLPLSNNLPVSDINNASLTTYNTFATFPSFSKFKKSLTDDARSIVSFKSTKSELGKSTALSKRNKLKLKHDILLHKIDNVNKIKKKQKQRQKRKNIAIIGDTNALHDALPSLESLLKSRDFNTKVAAPKGKKKAIAKSSKRTKSVSQDVNLFKSLLTNKKVQNNPLLVISEHVKARIKSGEL